MMCGNGTCLAAKEEKFDRPVEEVAGRAPDHDAFKRAVCRIQHEPAPDFGGQATSRAGVFIQIRGTIEKHHPATHVSLAFPVVRTWPE
jgi:hypothetical protein